jgi:hypothetical protein
MILLLVFVVRTTEAQQAAPDSTRVLETIAVESSAPSATLSGPRLTSQRLQSIEPARPYANVFMNSPAVVQGGRHTIVVSTLALVLAAIIVVLLVAD